MPMAPRFTGGFRCLLVFVVDDDDDDLWTAGGMDDDGTTGANLIVWLMDGECVSGGGDVKS